ncbi:hypothetical protein AB995_0975 [Lactococcus cremoris]|nr:hypothetical protein AB995_0975 [Lactococcus cremoris]KZK41989.1 hypothetical protein LMG6897_0860 [Lactococcus cremoris]
MLILFSNEEVDNISQIMESNTNYVVLPVLLQSFPKNLF